MFFTDRFRLPKDFRVLHKKISGNETRIASACVFLQAEMVDEETKAVVAVCDFYFLQEDGGRFKVRTFCCCCLYREKKSF